MNKAMIRILPALLLVLLPLAVVAQEEREEIDRIVALVEEDVILKSELDQSIEGIRRQVEGRGESLPPRNVLEEQVLERLIMTRLEILRAEATGIRISDADVDNALNRVSQQNNMSLTQLRNALEADGIDFEEFRREVRNEMMTSRLRQRVVNSMEEISETEVDIMLASERFGGREYLLSQILISLPDSADPGEVREARERVDEVLEQIEGGMSFSAAAISYSQGPDALEGGEVGWRNINALPRVVGEAIENVESGGVTEPIRTPAGFLILNVRDVRDQGEVIVNEYRARHLLIEANELVSMDEARRQIENLHQQIEQGEDFAELAREYSADRNSANLGGLLDWFPAGAYGPDIQQAIENLEPGEISQPFQTRNGWHLVMLEDLRQADRTEEAMRSEAREMLFQQKAEEEVDRFLRQLRSESFVEVRL